MSLWKSIVSGLEPGIPMGVAVAAIVASLFVVHHFFERRIAAGREGLGRQVTMLVFSLVGLLILIVVSPLSDAQKGQLLSLIGILLSATIALSATTFLGNAMAGVMLRAVRSFRMGDFIRVGDQFGRVSERGLFHTEIQTEDRDLVTLPNLHLVTNPVKVIRASGTIISAEVSLGYNVPRADAERLLIEAAGAAELEEAFVLVTELGDFSVNYRVSGLLKDVKQVITVRSRLRKRMLDALHGDGVEIVSPNFMNTRALGAKALVIPEAPAVPAAPEPASDAGAEALAFDKAEEAESLENLQKQHDELAARIEELGAQLKAADSDDAKLRLSEQVARLEAERERLASRLLGMREQLDG